MTSRVNSAEGGSNGTVVTTANSGGSSGDAFDAVYIPTGTTFTFATAAAYKGSLGYQWTNDNTSSGGPTGQWSLLGWPQLRARFYLRTSAYPTDNYTIVAAVTAPGTFRLLAYLMLSRTGRLQVVNAAGTVLFTGSAAIGLNTWIRVELNVLPGTTTTNGTIKFCWAVGDTAATDTFTSTSANTGTGGALGDLHLGRINGAWATTGGLDDLKADDASVATFIGASGSGPVVTDPTSPPVAPVASWPPPAPFSTAVRFPGDRVIWVDASLGGILIDGATDLRPVGGQITDTSKPGVRRNLTLDLPPAPGLADLLRPRGVLLKVTERVVYSGNTYVDVPMGVFDVDSRKVTEGSGGISLTAPDKWMRVVRAKFIVPFSSSPGARVVDQIAVLIQGALGADEPVNILASSQALVGSLTWDRDRDKAIQELADGIGAWVYFDRNGVATIADVPIAGFTPAWTVDYRGPSPVGTALDRSESRTDMVNVWVVVSTSTDEEPFPTQYVWDNDPTSPTYAGPDPLNDPGAAGPMGLSVDYLETALPLSAGEARAAGGAKLARSTGLAAQASMEQVPNPALDAFDVIDLRPPPEYRGQTRLSERQIVDTVTHPLTLGPAQQIEARSVRDYLLGV